MNGPGQPTPGSAAETMREGEERLRAILQTAVEGIITIDERGVIESANPAAESIFGYTSAEMIGQNVSMLMPAPYRAAHDGYVAAYLQTGQAKIIGIGREVVGRRKNGSVFPMDLSVSEVKLGPRRLFTGFVRDITERKRLEAEVLRVSEHEKTRIGRDLHDGLGQHLAGLQLLCHALERKLAGARSREAKEAAGRVGELARHVSEAIGQTRQLARGLTPMITEADGLMAALAQLAASTTQVPGVQCRFECDAPVLLADSAAATHLYRIAQEAVSNAIRHGHARRIDICLRSLSSRTFLLIKDDGSGLPEGAAQGPGLGLRIMAYRAGMLGGSLSVKREPGGGTSVLCSLETPPS